jgi:sugar/nucleoside kinase (ribokinase family)
LNFDILVYGPVFCDLIFTDLPDMPELGKEIFAGDFIISPGGSAIVAIGLHRLGAKVGLIADLGSDPLSKIIWEQLGDLGLDRSLITQHPYPLPQVTAALSFPEDRAFVTRFQRPEKNPDLKSILHANPTKHLHLCSFLAALDAPESHQMAHAAGATISMDPGWDEIALQNTKLKNLITELDVFLPSRSELCYITQEENLELAAHQQISQMQNGKLIIKDGSNGAFAKVPGQSKLLHTPALPVNPVDTTGAGDAFDAGFLYAFINNFPLKTCLQYGAICGGLGTTASGGVTALPTLTEVEKWLTKLQ